jgi:hypothetical protein
MTLNTPPQDQAKAKRVLNTHEEVFQAIDEWIDGPPGAPKDREYHVRRTHLGHYCTLSIRNAVVAFAHARGSDLAIELALQKYYEAE